MDSHHLFGGGTVDSHFHSLQMSEDGLPVRDLLSEAFDHGLEAALDIGVSAGDLSKRLSLCEEFSNVFFTVGISPSELKDIDEKTAESRIDSMMDELERTVSIPRVLGIGEIGLDYYRMDSSRELQLDLFVRQLGLASRHDLPVVIHSREADDDMVKILELEAPSRKGIMHCFSSDAPTALRLADLGFYISFAGNLTYPKNRTLHEAARMVPAEKLLVETDSPYLSPVPVRGRPNNPGNVGYTLRFLAELRNIDPDKLAEAIFGNFKNLFRL